MHKIKTITLLASAVLLLNSVAYAVAIDKEPKQEPHNKIHKMHPKPKHEKHQGHPHGKHHDKDKNHHSDDHKEMHEDK